MKEMIPAIGFGAFLFWMAVWIPVCSLVIFDLVWAALPFKQAMLANLYIVTAPGWIALGWIGVRLMRGKE